MLSSSTARAMRRVSASGVALSAALFLLVVCSPRGARAEEGNLPVFEFGVMSGLTMVPFTYTIESKFLAPYERSESKLGLPLGPRAALHLDVGNVVLSGGGSFNVLPAGGLASSLSFEVGGSALLGGRTTVPLRQIIASETRVTHSGGYKVTETTNTYAIYGERQLPLVYGLHLGLRAIGMRETVLPQQGTRPEYRKAAKTLVVPELGFGVVSGQFEALLAGAYAVGGAWGARWVVQGAPGLIGSWPLSVRLEGQHFFGSASDLTVGHILLFGVVVGTSVGVSSP